MEYVQLEGIHIHEDGYAKFIELTLIYPFPPPTFYFHGAFFSFLLEGFHYLRRKSLLQSL